MADIKLISSTAMKSTLDEVLPKFERDSGHKVVPSYGPSPRLTQQIADGEACDAAIVGAQNIEDLTKQGKVAAGTSCAIAASPIALAVQKGAPRPDISTAEKFKQALLAARSIAMSNPVGHYLVRKEIEIGIQQLPELMMVPGIDIVGPLPEGVQSVTVFTGGVSAAAKNPDGAATLLKFLATPEVAAVVRAKGMEI
jgi:molybdate transport system substrate-binding protein